MAEDMNVRIVGWPDEPVQLAHRFDPDTPAPVQVSFDTGPARVFISTDPRNTLAVDMNMNLQVPETLPICIRLCEPICAESNYTISISIFDRPVITLTIRGKTRLFSSREDL
jgi:hypothetical protein